MTAIIVLAILAVGASWLLWGHLKQIQANDERELVRRKKMNLDQADLDRASDEGMNHPDDGIK